MHDKFVNLVTKSTVACSMLVGPDESDVELLDVNCTEDIADLVRKWAPRQLRWVGAIALVNGKPGVALAEPLSGQCLGAIILAFENYCDERITGQQDAALEVAELERLWLLSDMRLN